MALEVIERKEYMDRLWQLRDTQLIKVITGVRRCGKSTLLMLFMAKLKKNGVEDGQIQYINFEDLDSYELRNPMKLYAHLKSHLQERKSNYIILDEIQHVENFPEVVDSLYIRPGVDIYITGSNAYMLSSEIATVLSGRYVELAMLPLSFREFTEAIHGEENLPVSYKAYIENSSFPYALALRGRPDILEDYLEGIFNTIIVKDIMTRKKVSDPLVLESVVRFLFNSIGNLISTKKITDTLRSNGRTVSSLTVETYLAALQESFVLYRASRYNVKGKEYLKTLEKYYLVDIGLRRVLLGRKAADVGHILENVVYLELLRRHYKVYVGKWDDKEVDFVAMGRDGIVYIQVFATVRDEKTLKRELAPLVAIPDNYPKLLLTLDEDPEADYNGIRQKNALEWMMGYSNGFGGV